MFTWWDRLHRTIRLNIPQAEITIGVLAYRGPSETSLWRVLALPFRRQRPSWRYPDGIAPERELSTAPRRQLLP